MLQSGRPTELVRVAILPNDQIDRGFAATVQATEMAVVNALGAAPMTGVNGHRVAALPPDRLRDALRKYGRLTP